MTTDTISSTQSSKTKEFYEEAAKYWSQVPPTINGMLGGFGKISATDIHGSKSLLKQLFNSKQFPGRGYALDCGAGIGRITRFLLCNLFDKVDMVEQNPLFLEAAKRYIGPNLMENKIGEMFAVGLQNFVPEAGKYDVIWIQWVLGHLTDTDFVQFFTNCRNGLKSNGLIVVKENITSTDSIEVDERDSSMTRPIGVLKDLFRQADLDCFRVTKQLNFPKGIYSVYMFVLKPSQFNAMIKDIKSSDTGSSGEISPEDGDFDNQLSLLQPEGVVDK
ncbi:N-terminal Xaa-Pro-Lys N-methyltransferase 1 [Euwallacea fornicatus]|uniref:N-terminal Xaa-Pro-Lys N-methyltransferase 1 n=1 Tax=Euwallacea fornicatus TaxID=995702 RepID=UPI00338F8FC3